MIRNSYKHLAITLPLIALSLFLLFNLNTNNIEVGKQGAQVGGVGTFPNYLSKESSCGDNMCNPRSEDHWNCSSECKGPYFIVDKNNSSCTNDASVAGAGTAERPFCDALVPEKANKLKPGTTVYIKGGIQKLNFTDGRIRTSGTSDAYITFRNYPGETPILELGDIYDSSWTEESSLNDDIYSFYKSTRPITDFGWETSATKGKRLMGLTIDGRNPLSILLSMNDLKNRKFVNPETNPIPFDALHVDCNGGPDYGKTYLRLQKGVDPNFSKPYFTTYSRFSVMDSSYLRFIGIHFKYGREAIKINSLDSISTNVEIYDNVFFGLTMPIGDHGGPSSSKNIIDGNRFLNNSKLLVVNANNTSLNGDYICESEVLALGGTWKYEWQKWDHVLYGGSNDIRFSNNYVDGGNTQATVALVDGEYFNNYMKNGDFFGSKVRNYPLLFYNNIVENPNGSAIRINAGFNHNNNIKFFNNLFVSRNVPHGIAFHGKVLDNIVFKNNIVIRSGSESDINKFCLYFADGYKYVNRPDTNNNLYIGCNSWYMTDGKDGDGRVKVNTLADWSNFLGGGDSKSYVDSIAFDVLGYSDIWSTLTSKYSDKIFDKGECLREVSSDINGKTRPTSGCDIGPYEDNSDFGGGDPAIINASCSTTLNSCRTGTFQDQEDSSTEYLWQCIGLGGGSNFSCSISKTIQPSLPTPTPNPNPTPTPTPTPPPPPPPLGGTNGLCATTLNSCRSGSFSDVEDTSTKYNWSCLGLNGGYTASCSLDRFLPPINNTSNTTSNTTPNTTPDTTRPTNTSTYRPGQISTKINYQAPTINIPTTTVDVSMPKLPSWLDFITAFVLDIANDIIRGVKRTGEMVGI